MKITLYVEGGGDHKSLQIRCREGFHKMLKKAGIPAPTPKIVASGSRNQTFNNFRNGTRGIGGDESCCLLVDSEDRFTASTKWEHVRARDAWNCPPGISENQLYFMVTCMETWICADRAALRRVFGSNLRENALPSLDSLESRERGNVQNALSRATANCAKGYEKGEISFQVLAELNPDELKLHVPAFWSFIDGLSDLVRS